MLYDEDDDSSFDEKLIIMEARDIKPQSISPVSLLHDDPHHLQQSTTTVAPQHPQTPTTIDDIERTLLLVL